MPVVKLYPVESCCVSAIVVNAIRFSERKSCYISLFSLFFSVLQDKYYTLLKVLNQSWILYDTRSFVSLCFPNWKERLRGREMFSLFLFLLSFLFQTRFAQMFSNFHFQFIRIIRNSFIHYQECWLRETITRCVASLLSRNAYVKNVNLTYL